MCIYKGIIRHFFNQHRCCRIFSFSLTDTILLLIILTSIVCVRVNSQAALLKTTQTICFEKFLIEFPYWLMCWVLTLKKQNKKSSSSAGSNVVIMCMLCCVFLNWSQPAGFVLKARFFSFLLGSFLRFKHDKQWGDSFSFFRLRCVLNLC